MSPSEVPMKMLVDVEFPVEPVKTLVQKGTAGADQ